MSKPVSGLNVFQNQAGPIPLSQLDANFTSVTNALNDIGTYSNYFADSSGAANTITVTVAAPLTFAYVTGILLQVKLANTNTSTTVNINVNALGNKPVLLNDGTAPPVGSLTVNSILDLMFDGTNFLVLSMRGTTSISTGLFGDGSAGSPSIGFAADTNTGWFRVGADDIGVSTGGTLRLDISTTAFTGTLPWRGQDGTAGAPALSFSGDTDSGWFRNAANDVRGAAGGSTVIGFDTTRFFTLQQIQGPAGSAATPSFSTSDSDTGMYSSGANELSFSTGGTFAGRFGASQQFLEPDGSAAAPPYSFNSDPDTGFYRDTANQIGITLGGTTAGQIVQGTFTGTLTGMNASTTGTVNYQRIGKHVRLWVNGNILGTSNATTFTMTGLPSICQPGGGTTAHCQCSDSVGTVFTQALLSSGSGTITFQKSTASGSGVLFDSNAWTNSGTKGLSDWQLGYAV